MELALIPVLAVFVLFAVSGAAFFAARRTGIPHSVILVAIGVLLIPLSYIPGFAFLQNFTLTPELLFYIFLPTLIFESAYNINIRRLTADAIPVALLSIASLLISALAIAVGLYFLLPLVGLPIPFSIAFLFGSLISATDPVAVLALFKEYGAPRRLSLLFEGESLFNDGTGLALFLVALEFAVKNDFSLTTIGEGVFSFTIMLIGGAILGLIFGGVFSKAVGYARSSETVAITLTLVLAHVTFLVSEYISANMVIGGFHVHLSSIIATTMAAMVMGNYGRPKMPHGAEEFVEKFWGQIAFFANSIIFILIGTLAVSLPISSPVLLVPIILTVLIVASARALSIYPVVGFWNTLNEARAIPRAWQHLLAWGSLRGALAVTMALLIPQTLSVPGWTNDVSAYNVILAFTTGCIFVTLFVKATTIGPMMRRLKVTNLSPLETAEYDEGRALVYAQVLRRLERFKEKAYISEETFDALHAHYTRRFEESCSNCANIKDTDTALAEAALRIWTLGIEKRALQDLYMHDEISEDVFKRIHAKLTHRTEEVESGQASNNIHMQLGHDVFEKLASWARALVTRPSAENTVAHMYMYYRAHMIIAHKAQKELERIRGAQSQGLFSPAVIDTIEATYRAFIADAAKEMRVLTNEHPRLIAPLAFRLARGGVLKVEGYVLEKLHSGEMVTPKVYAILQEELHKEIDEMEYR